MIPRRFRVPGRPPDAAMARAFRRPDRRDRLLLIRTPTALAIAMLSLLGAAGERIGYDRWLKANTVKRRADGQIPISCLLTSACCTTAKPPFRGDVVGRAGPICM